MSSFNSKVTRGSFQGRRESPEWPRETGSARRAPHDQRGVPRDEQQEPQLQTSPRSLHVVPFGNGHLNSGNKRGRTDRWEMAEEEKIVWKSSLLDTHQSSCGMAFWREACWASGWIAQVPLWTALLKNSTKCPGAICWNLTHGIALNREKESLKQKWGSTQLSGNPVRNSVCRTTGSMQQAEQWKDFGVVGTEFAEVLRASWKAAGLQSVLESWRRWIDTSHSNRIDELADESEDKQTKGEVSFLHVLLCGLLPEAVP